MSPTGTAQSPLAQAIALLQDALKKESFDKKGAHSDIVKATNLLLGSLGLPGVAPDTGVGQ